MLGDRDVEAKLRKQLNRNFLIEFAIPRPTRMRL